MDIKEEIHALSEEMLTNLGRLVAIDSQLGTPSEGKPFGEGPAKALEEGLKIAEELGFKTVNLDNYCGYAEMGEGDEIVGIAGHLDIVPVGGDWTYDPFRLTREDDHVYGRGTTDDKGPIPGSALCHEASPRPRREAEQKSPPDHGLQRGNRFQMYGSLQSGSRRAFLRFHTGCQLPVYPR